MTEPSAFSAKGLSIVVRNPITFDDGLIDSYTNLVNSYSHVVSATAGYQSAEFNISGNLEFMENWLEYGLGRHVQVYGPSGTMIWEGFVNEITGNFGYATFSRGPLMDVGNRVTIWYTPKFICDPADPLYDPNNPCDEGEIVTGTEMPWTTMDNADSINRYGIIEKIVNVGEQYAKIDILNSISSLYLEENAYPQWNPSLSVSGNAGELSINVSCRGYYDWLSAYPYNIPDTNIKEWKEYSNIIQVILTADPNGIFSHDYSRIDFNPSIQIMDYMDDKLAKTIIDDLITLGDVNYNRWTFGIYQNRRAVYAQIPSEVEYIYYKTGKTQQVETLSGAIVEPWDVMPCKWTAIPTFLTSFPFRSNNVREDPRIFFAEEVTFTAPDQVNITGAKIRKFDQYIARMGLYGA